MTQPKELTYPRWRDFVPFMIASLAFILIWSRHGNLEPFLEGMTVYFQDAHYYGFWKTLFKPVTGYSAIFVRFCSGLIAGSIPQPYFMDAFYAVRLSYQTFVSCAICLPVFRKKIISADWARVLIAVSFAFYPSTVIDTAISFEYSATILLIFSLFLALDAADISWIAALFLGLCTATVAASKALFLSAFFPFLLVFFRILLKKEKKGLLLTGLGLLGFGLQILVIYSNLPVHQPNPYSGQFLTHLDRLFGLATGVIWRTLFVTGLSHFWRKAPIYSQLAGLCGTAYLICVLTIAALKKRFRVQHFYYLLITVILIGGLAVMRWVYYPNFNILLWNIRTEDGRTGTYESIAYFSSYCFLYTLLFQLREVLPKISPLPSPLSPLPSPLSPLPSPLSPLLGLFLFICSTTFFHPVFPKEVSFPVRWTSFKGFSGILDKNEKSSRVVCIPMNPYPNFGVLSGRKFNEPIITCQYLNFPFRNISDQKPMIFNGDSRLPAPRLAAKNFTQLIGLAFSDRNQVATAPEALLLWSSNGKLLNRATKVSDPIWPFVFYITYPSTDGVANISFENQSAPISLLVDGGTSEPFWYWLGPGPGLTEYWATHGR